MWKVQYKRNAGQAWTTLGSYGSENSALNNASRIASQHEFVRVLDPDGDVVWSGRFPVFV